VSIKDLLAAADSKIDNTGNICVWPSEDVLAWYMLRHCVAAPARAFQGKHVLELGAGMAGVAGMMIAAVTDASSVVLTDGNAAAVKLLEENVERNKAATGSVYDVCNS
jgi:calmodulin-lysine N-methyltransferase